MEIEEIEEIAEICHEVNLTYCYMLGDRSQLTWLCCPEWQKESAIKGVQNVIDNPNLGPGDSHKCWYKQKEADGWVYGKEKHVGQKTHPCMVPYDQLSAEQRAKDVIFIAVVKGCMDCSDTRPFAEKFVDIMDRSNAE